MEKNQVIKKVLKTYLELKDKKEMYEQEIDRKGKFVKACKMLGNEEKINTIRMEIDDDIYNLICCRCLISVVNNMIASLKPSNNRYIKLYCFKRKPLNDIPEQKIEKELNKLESVFYDYIYSFRELFLED